MNDSRNWTNKRQAITNKTDYVTPEPDIKITDIAAEPEPVNTVVETKIGIVVNCPRLNVRANPRANADVVCIIASGSKVMIDESGTTENFYKVCTEVGVEGYCMKRFINILA